MRYGTICNQRWNANGEVEIGGAKNAALAILAAAIMTDETVTIENLPNVRDINVLLQAIAEIGAMVDRIDAHSRKDHKNYLDINNVTPSFSKSQDIYIKMSC